MPIARFTHSGRHLVGTRIGDHLIDLGQAAPGCAPSIKAFLQDGAAARERFDRVVIGTRCRNVARNRAREVTGGFLIVNDVSVRGWPFRPRTATLGKSFDTPGPNGPWLTLADEIDDPHNLRLRAHVNGDLRQDGNTRDLLHDVYDQIAYLGQVMTLMPGEILATGTPAGVGIAFDPPRFLKVADVVRITIDDLGPLENPLIPDPALPA